MEKEIQLIIDNLDFSGSHASWFDNWSSEFDWEGEGNKSSQARSKYLKLMLKFFNEAKQKLKKYPKDYQLWMEIVESDSRLDGIHIHTANPNNTPFPIKMAARKGPKIESAEIVEFILKSKLTALEAVKNGSKVIIAFDPEIGTVPVEIS